MAGKENEEIKKAKSEVEVLSKDEQERYIYELRQKAIRDEKNIRESGYEDGLEAGRKEREQEIYELKQKAKLETAKKMLEKKIPIETIIEITGLTEGEIRS